MAKSLNPQAAENREQDARPESSPESSSSPSSNDDERRGFLVKLAAGAIGVVLGIFPVAAGALTILDPLIGKKKTKGEKIRVATIEQLPDDGTPVRVPIVADLVDAWNREPNQPIGAVYLRREGDNVVAFNAICPHAGCFVGYASDTDVFQCPCHTSTFELDGARVMPSPSPRDLDKLVVDEDRLAGTGEIWIDFVNYYPGKAQQIPKA
jgi:menaquinol-cytochrome c reductase iron-sulfur subunit